MALQRNTRDIIDASVSKRTKFNRGNVWGKWFDQKYFRGQIGWLNGLYADLLSEHSALSRVYVLYSYNTPMAWYSPHHNKWYFPEDKYSPSTTAHQTAYRYALKGQTVVTLTYDEKDKLVETEKEFY